MSVKIVAKKSLIEVREEKERVPNLEIDMTDLEIENIELCNDLKDAEISITDNEIAIAELQERMEKNA
jgi:hypothetical protein